MRVCRAPQPVLHLAATAALGEALRETLQDLPPMPDMRLGNSNTQQAGHLPTGALVAGYDVNFSLDSWHSLLLDYPSGPLVGHLWFHLVMIRLTLCLSL